MALAYLARVAGDVGCLGEPAMLAGLQEQAAARGTVGPPLADVGVKPPFAARSSPKCASSHGARAACKLSRAMALAGELLRLMGCSLRKVPRCRPICIHPRIGLRWTLQWLETGIPAPGSARLAAVAQDLRPPLK